MVHKNGSPQLLTNVLICKGQISTVLLTLFTSIHRVISSLSVIMSSINGNVCSLPHFKFAYSFMTMSKITSSITYNICTTYQH